jgi:hypothetical protein
MPGQKIDLGRVTPASAHAAGAAAAARSLEQFVAVVRHTVGEAAERVAAQANTVTVQPGGRAFSTIQAALDSITDASLKKQYLVLIGPGTYNEVVACKPWVFLQGSGDDQTVITAPGVQDFGSKGTVKGASHSAIQNLAVQSTGNGWGCWAVAVACDQAVEFDVENCLLTSSDNVGGANMIGLAVDYLGGASGSKVYVAYTTVLANCVAGQSQPLALLAFAGSFVQVTESKLVAQGGTSGWGGASNGGSNLTVDGSFVEGAGFSLNIPDYNSTCVANQCQLVGPVQNGVVVNP